MDEQHTLDLNETNEPAAAMPRTWDTQMRSYRVRLIRFDRPQSKTLQVRSNSEAGARTQAQSRAGRDWRVARIEAV
ncbi:MAG: hypothetical protein NXI30_07470 [bacterium]|nr:hypothetical protein [bacterium]